MILTQLQSTRHPGRDGSEAAAAAPRWRNERLDKRPLLIRQVTRIAQMITIVFRSVLIRPHRRGKRRTDLRAVMNGVMYILSTGCQWRYLPKDFPPRSTVHNYFVWWHCDGTLDRIHQALYAECREKADREASPTACIIDSQSVKSAEKGGGPASIRTGSMRAN